MTDKRLPYIIASGILVIIIIAAIFLVYLPLSSQIQTKRTEISEKTAHLELVQKKVRELNKLRNEIQRIQEELALLENQVPKNSDVPGIVRLMEDFATRSNVIITNVTIQNADPTLQASGGNENGTTTGASAININTCQITVNGTYTSLLNFFNSLKSSPRLFGIINVQISPEEEDGKKLDVIISLAYFNYKAPSNTPVDGQ